VEFMERGWSVKSLARMMLLSSACQMSSASDARNAKIDPTNRFLWRANRRRLEAEQIRDGVLAVTGNINLKMGGPSVVPPLSKEEFAGMRDSSQWPLTSDPTEYRRRSVYLYVKRGFRMPMLESFDMPETSLSCERRDATTVAPQALTLMNSEFSLMQAKAFAESLPASTPQSPAAPVRAAWLRALGRAPTAAEEEKALEFLARQDDTGSKTSRLTKLCLMLFNMNEFLYVD